MSRMSAFTFLARLLASSAGKSRPEVPSATTSGIAPARAAINAMDNSPGATVLFPYFEVDPNDPNGRDTLISFSNASATAILGHVTVWTDMGLPVLTFNVYQTGYDISTFSMRELLVNGNLPRTASAGQDPGDQISNKGDFSQDINFASCSGQLPYPNGILVPGFRADLQLALSGRSAAFLNGKCAAASHGDTLDRGYITIDVVNNCTARKPGDVGYFSPGGTGDATNQNVLYGEYFIVDPANQFLHQGKAVAIEASAIDPATSTAGNYTFYGRLPFNGNKWSAVDNREPLPTTWAVDAQAGAGTELIVWRDTKSTIQPFTCGVSPGQGLPLQTESAFTFDNQEKPLAVPPGGSPFGLATQRVKLGNAAFPLPAKPGWVYLGLSYTNPIAGSNPSQDIKADQAYVTVVQHPEVSYGTTGATATALDGAQTARHVHPDTP